MAVSAGPAVDFQLQQCTDPGFSQCSRKRKPFLLA